VNHFSPEGKLVAQWGARGTNTGRFALPRAVAVNSRGDLFVSEYTTVDRVQAFSGATRNLLMVFGRPGTGDGEFNRAEGLGIDGADRIYVADSCNHRVQIFSPEGKWLRSFGRAGRGPGELSYPYDVRVDAAGRKYVCEFGNSRIQIFDAQDQPLEILGGAGAGPGKFNNPWSIALDSRGNLYIADSGNHRVQKFVRRSGSAGRPISGSPRPALRGEQRAVSASWIGASWRGRIARTPLGFQLHHPGGMVENSPAFQRRGDGKRAPSPAGTAEIECFSRPSGTYPSGTSIPALKRRAIIASPSGTETGPVASNRSRSGRTARTPWARDTPGGS
jgi:hypothetical protein